MVRFCPAIQVNQALLEQHNIPPEVKTFLLQRKSEWEQQTSYWRNQLSFLYGHSNNLNNATYLDEIDRLIGFERAEPGSLSLLTTEIKSL